MVREVSVHTITEKISKMCVQANLSLSADMRARFLQFIAKEESLLGRKVLEQLEENLEIAAQEQIPICQDTGMAIVFLEIGQDLHLVDGDLTEAVNEGVQIGRASCRERV